MADDQWNLLEKTELTIRRIGLDVADLTNVARAVADVLGLPHADVLVIDARDDLLSLDILRGTADARALVGQKQALLAALATIPGIHLDDRSTLEAHGMLGWIAEDAADASEALERSLSMAIDIERTIATRALIYSTGPEVITKKIKDTNSPWIAEQLRAADWTAVEGGVLPDDPAKIASAFVDGAERGFGLVITTGGVGAEGKDGTVEALLSVDADASTPYVMRVQSGVGRHIKPGIRIGVGTVFGARVICLPGPHSEVQIGVPAMITGLSRGLGQDDLAEYIAARLRAHLRQTHMAPHNDGH